jgi:hypothetical protein
MKKLNGRHVRVLFFLSIVVPVGLLTTLKVADIVQSPIAISKVETLETIVWETERPDSFIAIRNSITSIHEGELKLIQDVTVGHYDDESFYGSAMFWMGVNISASAANGYIHSIHLGVADMEHSDARISFFKAPDRPILQNLSIVNSKGFGQTVQTAFVDFVGKNYPSQIYLLTSFEWFLWSPSNQTHTLEIQSQVTYYNGSAYNKIVQPFRIIAQSDNNNSFQTATEVNEGNYTRLYIGRVDSTDYYKLCMNQGDIVELNIGKREQENDRDHPRFAVYIYDSEERLILQTEPDYSHKVEFTAGSTGDWYIELRADGFSHGFYSMEISR